MSSEWLYSVLGPCTPSPHATASGSKTLIDLFLFLLVSFLSVSASFSTLYSLLLLLTFWIKTHQRFIAYSMHFDGMFLMSRHCLFASVYVRSFRAFLCVTKVNLKIKRFLKGYSLMPGRVERPFMEGEELFTRKACGVYHYTGKYLKMNISALWKHRN